MASAKTAHVIIFKKSQDSGEHRLAGEQINEGRNVKEVYDPVFIDICLGLEFAVGKDGNEGRNI